MKSFLSVTFARLSWILRTRLQKGVVRLEKNVDGLQKDVGRLLAMTEWLYYENSRLSALVRHLSAPVINTLPDASQTRGSFDFQWDSIPLGRWSLDHPEFRKEATDYVLQFTGLPESWFTGKSVIDVGCGAGRYSWAMSKLGANVLSVDQSAHGLEKTAEVCREFPGHRTKQVDLLKPLDLDETFDMVWSFGVLHHTGDTYGAFCRVAPLVRPGGYLFLMLYGEPRLDQPDDFAEVAEYDLWRRRTRNMTLVERLRAIREGMDAHQFRAHGDLLIEGYFDAISPRINDLYTFDEIENWLLSHGFSHIRRTVDTRNHIVVARKL